MDDLLLCRHASQSKLPTTSLTVSVQLIERKIYLIRNQKVMVYSDLAELYGVTTSRLNEQVTRRDQLTRSLARVLKTAQVASQCLR